MCDPITLAGIALTVGSTVANTVAQNKVQAARDNAMAAERIRQNGLDKEAQALSTQSQDRYQNFGDQQDQRSSELGQYFTDQKIEAGDANAAATRESTIPQSGSNITVAEEAKQRGQASEFTDNQGQALGNLRSFGDLVGEIGRGQARDASQIGQIGGFKRGSSAVLPYELEAANGAGNGAKLFGDILGLAGSVTTAKGLGGGVKTVDPWVTGGTDFRKVGSSSGNLFSLFR
jgi:hypothetical protein